MTLTAAASATPARRAIPLEAAAALLVALGALAVEAVSGFPRFSDAGGDNDSLLRLVQIRDLLAGQGWFDPQQYRMGPEGGFAMHWSRLIDAPVALLILLFGLLPIGPAMAEMAAATLWPTMLMAAALYFLIRAANAVGGEAAVLPAAVLGGAAFHYTGIFAPGALDHHNAQVALAMATLAFLTGRPTLGTGVLAGLAAAAMLAIGMEAMPYTAAAGLAVALRFLVWGRTESAPAAGFGLGLGAGAVAALVATVPPAGWLSTTCDALSFGQAGAGVLAGFGLAAVAMLHVSSASPARRAVALAGLGAALAAFALAAFPQCLGDPYAALDPRLKRYWLDSVVEAQPVWKMVFHSPAQAAACYVTPLIALWLAVAALVRRGPDARTVTVLAMLAVAVAVSFWQVRGALFSLAFAIVPLSGWIAGWRARAATSGETRVALRMAAAWLVSVNIVWGTAAAAANSALATPAGNKAAADADEPACYAARDFQALAMLPATTVLSVSNLGSAILAHSGHRVLAGPYHRNVEGNLLVLDAMMGSPDEARRIARENGVGLLAICPGNSETEMLARWAPDGFLDRLGRGEVPDWLERLPGGPDDALVLYRVAAP